MAQVSITTAPEQITVAPVWTSDRSPSYETGSSNRVLTDLRQQIGGTLSLRGINLKGADLRQVNLEGVDLSDADLSDTNLTGANLRNADLTRANLSYATLTNAYLDGVDLCHADLSHALCNGTSLVGGRLYQADLCRANLQRACLVKVYAVEAQFQDAILDETDLRWANLSRTNFSGAYLRKLKLGFSIQRGANLQDVLSSEQRETGM